jgi:HD-like signal output (HDOD) protein
LKRVLFVDDEPNVLDGLQRMLRPLRNDWTMEFAASGPCALTVLSENPFDVVVSDMRMPGMDGAQLLTEVRRLYPKTVRIVLSGQSDHELIMKTIGPAHQYLSKPCDAQELKDTVTRACALRDLLTDHKLQLLVSQMKSLPSIPALYSALMDEIGSPNISLKKVGEIIAQDPAMTAKILQLINSAFFGLRRHISSPAEATALLGVDTVTALVLSAQIFVQFKNTSLRDYSMDKVWAHCSTVGSVARAIAKCAGQGQHLADQSFTAGLLHETGSLVLAAQLPERYGEALIIARDEGISVDEAENRVFGAAHPEVGAYLLGIWGLPDAIVEAVAFHHVPGRCLTTKFHALAAVHLADHFDTISNGNPTCPLDTTYLDSLELLDRIGAFEELHVEITGG